MTQRGLCKRKEGRLKSRQAARRVHLVETVQRLLRWIFTHIRTRVDEKEMCGRSGVNVKVEPHLNVYTWPFIHRLSMYFIYARRHWRKNYTIVD